MNGASNVADSGMLLSSLESVLSAQFSGSDTVSCINGETDFTTSYTLAANYLVANKLLRVTIAFSDTTSSSPPGMAFNLKMGSTSVYTATKATPAASLSGSPGGITFYIQGTAAAGASVAVHTHPIVPPGMNNAAGVPFDTSTIAQPQNLATNGTLVIKPGLACSAATSGNSITLNQMIVEALN